MSGGDLISVIVDAVDIVVMALLAWVVLRRLAQIEGGQASRAKTQEELLLSIEEYTRTVRHILKGEVAAARMTRAVYDALGTDEAPE